MLIGFLEDQAHPRGTVNSAQSRLGKTGIYLEPGFERFIGVLSQRLSSQSPNDIEVQLFREILLSVLQLIQAVQARDAAGTRQYATKQIFTIQHIFITTSANAALCPS